MLCALLTSNTATRSS